MEHLSDEALWAIARSTANDDKIALYDVLIERQNAHTLTLEGKHLLTQLRDEADAPLCYARPTPTRCFRVAATRFRPLMHCTP